MHDHVFELQPSYLSITGAYDHWVVAGRRVIQGGFLNHAVQPSAIDTEKIGDSAQLALLGASYDDPSPDVVFDALGSVLSGAPLAEILANVARIIEEHSKEMLCSISLLVSRLTH
jgi:hypothetical protein